MMKFIDNVLNQITMYRLALYYLIFLVGTAIVLSFTHQLPYDPYALMFTTSFLVLVCIFLGLTTPTESAVLGATGSLLLAACYRKLTWEIVRNSVMSTVKLAASIFIILTGAITFSQVLAFSGITRELASYISTLPLPPILIVICMQLFLLFLGTFMDTGAMIMVTMPIFMPIILALGIDPVWFGIVVLLNMEMSSVTPPVGMMLFVMKGVAPPDTKMADIYRASIPFLMCDLVAMALIMTFPILTLWLPNLMRF